MSIYKSLEKFLLIQIDSNSHIMPLSHITEPSNYVVHSLKLL